MNPALPEDARPGIAVHRANARAHATRTLEAAYPVVRALIGPDNLDGLAQALWHAHPPQHGDLACWGRELARLIETMPELADLPYLSDVARVEWALHEALGAPDAVPALQTLARLVNEDTSALTLQLAPGTTTVPSHWPVVSIVNAHTAGAPTLIECGQRLRTGVAEHALVWRHGWRAQLRGTDPAEAAWLTALQAGHAVSEAIDAALLEGAFDVGGWLTRSAADGLLIGVIDARAPQEPRDPPTWRP